MVLTANRQYRFGGRDKLALIAKDGVTIYAGAIVAVGGPGHADAGLAFPFVADQANVIVMGMADQMVVGDGQRYVSVFLDGGVIRNTPVAGLAGTVADVMAPVFLLDDEALTLVAPTTGQRRPKAGYVAKHIDGNNCDVYLFGARDWLAIHDATDGEVPATP